MGTRRPPMRGRRHDSISLPGGRRRSDPDQSGTRVAVLPDQRINVDQDHELRYWSEKLGVSREALRKAVQAVGPMVKDVQRHLHR